MSELYLKCRLKAKLPEELSRVRCANRFSLVDDGGVSVQERRVADVLVSHDPAKVGGGPPNLAGAKPWHNINNSLMNLKFKTYFQPIVSSKNTSIQVSRKEGPVIMNHLVRKKIFLTPFHRGRPWSTYWLRRDRPRDAGLPWDRLKCKQRGQVISGYFFIAGIFCVAFGEDKQSSFANYWSLLFFPLRYTAMIWTCNSTL